MSAMDDLLAPLEAEEAVVLARPVGSVDAPDGWHDRLIEVLAEARVWAGPLHGWRRVLGLRGDGTGALLWHRDRLAVGLSLDLGEAVLRRYVADDEDEAEAEEEAGEAAG